jgi:hypothetical protein
VEKMGANGFEQQVDLKWYRFNAKWLEEESIILWSRLFLSSAASRENKVSSF